MSAANARLDARDIGGTTRVLIRLSRVRNVPTAELREVLGRLNSLLLVPKIVVWPRELADIAFLLGKLQLQDRIVGDLLSTIAESAKYRLEHFTPHDLAGIAWGFATLNVRNEALMSVVAAEVVNKIASFDQRQLSNTAWAFAKCGLWNEQLVVAIANESLRKISNFDVQSLSHISWAMSQWGTRREDLMDAIAREAIEHISEFTPGPLAMTAWSFASLQLKDANLMAAISVESTATISQFKIQDLAHLAWACANLRIRDAPLFDAMASELQHNIHGAQPQELANIAWAFSKNNLSHEALMAAIATTACQKISQFKPAEVAMLTWAFAVAGLQKTDLMTQIGELVAKRVNSFSAPQLSHIAWAFGALSLRHGEFNKAVSAYVQMNADAFKAQGLSNIVWAFAMVTFCDEVLLRRVAPQIARDAAELRPLALARCAWAYRVLGVRASELFAALAAEALAKVDEFPTKALVKLVDSMYVTPCCAARARLEEVVASRAPELARSIRQTAGEINEHGQPNHSFAFPWPAATVDEYTTLLQGFGHVDFGIVGTPSLLASLNIFAPSASFVRKCWVKLRAASAQAPPEEDDGTSAAPTSEEASATMQRESGPQRELAVAEYRLTSSGAAAARGDSDEPGALPTANGWVICHGGTVPAAAAVAVPWLCTVDLPGRAGQAEATYGVLAELCARAAAAGVALDNPDARAQVAGHVQALSTNVPGLSSVGALWQFSLLFPNINLEFAEQVGAIEDS